MNRPCLKTVIGLWCIVAALGGCRGKGKKSMSETKPIGSVERLDPRLDALIAPGAGMEILAEGFTWTEGPLWIADGEYLLFSDIPPNKVMKWKEGEGVSLYLHPSGYTGTKPRTGEPGCNGLLLDPKGRLVLCQHGDRRMARMDAPLDAPQSKFETIVDRYEGKRFNSPNDAVYHSSGALYFTDPPYGLEKGMEDPEKELKFQGVYRLGTDGKLTLLTDEITRPNGIALSPDEKTLYVACSDPKKAVWYAYDVKPDGTIANGRILHDATKRVENKEPGLPDGLKVDVNGNLFATGPGGVFIFAPDGKLIGRLKTGERTSNCNWGGDGSDLYLTVDDYLVRIRTVTKGY